MKVVRIDYNDSEDIKNITVKMTRPQAVALVNILGCLNGYAQKKLKIDSDMYDCLSSIFNMHYEEGSPSLGIRLETLNEEE